MINNKKTIAAALLIGMAFSSHLEARQPKSPFGRRESISTVNVGLQVLAAAAKVISVTPSVAETISVRCPEGLHVDPVARRKLSELELDPGMAEALDKDLRGFVKVTSGDYRMVLRWSGLNEMTLVDVGARGRIYEALTRRLKESVKQSAIVKEKSELARQIEESEQFFRLRERLSR